MSLEYIRQIMQNLEEDNIERTVSVETEKLCKTICALANDMPNRGDGYIFIGVDDNGKVTGYEVTDRLLSTIADYRNNGGILPLPSYTVEKVDLPEGNIVMVKVTPSDMPPVRYKGQVWIRRGPTQSIASEQDERILTERSVSRAKTFDMKPCHECGESEIVHTLFRDYLLAAVDREIIEKNNREMTRQMASLGLWDNKHRCLTNAGALTLSEDPRRWIPGAYIQFLRLEGHEISSDVLDQRAFSNDLNTMLREVDAFIKTLFPSRPVRVSPMREKQVTPYPLKAIRELLMNATMHRDYESNAPIRFYWFADRIEIHNPGGLYGSASSGFPENTDYRNPKVAELMKTLGYVNRFGRGIAVVQDTLKANGNPPAEFDTRQQAVFQVTVREAERQA